MAKLATNSTVVPILTEGLDYILEGGYWVFTSSYLLERGYCCGSGCRNCPYEAVEVNSYRRPTPVKEDMKCR